MIDLPAPPEWMFSALCSEGFPPELWFPQKEKGHSSAPLAKKICGQCTVATKCLEWAMEIERAEGMMPGIYGGLGPVSRQKIRAAEKAAA